MYQVPLPVDRIVSSPWPPYNEEFVKLACHCDPNEVVTEIAVVNVLSPVPLPPNLSLPWPP